MQKVSHPWLFDISILSRNVKPMEVLPGSLLPKENLLHLMKAEYVNSEKNAAQHQTQRFVTVTNLVHLLIQGPVPLLIGLQSISLAEAVQQVNRVHSNHVIFLRSIAAPCRTVATKLLVEDNNGSAILLNVFNYVHPEEDLGNVFVEGAFLAVIEPLLIFDSGLVIMRCDNPQAICVFENEQEWMDAQANQFYNTPRMQECREIGYELIDFKRESVDKSNLLCDEGNNYFSKGDIKNALRYYSEGLRKCPINVRLLCNRGAAYMKLGRWQDALTDLETAISYERKHTKSRYRMCQVLLHLQRPSEAERHLIELWNDLEFRNLGIKSEIKSCEILMRSVKVALVEKKGHYDFKALHKEANCVESGGIRRELSRYHMDYIHPSLHVQESPAVGGKGLFTKTTLPHSNLVLGEKAMVFLPCPAHCFPPPADMLPKDRLLFHEVCRDNLAPAIIHELSMHPEVGNKLYFLSDGNTYFDPASCKEDLSRVDIPRIRNILTTNHISANTTQFERCVQSVLQPGAHAQANALSPVPAVVPPPTQTAYGTTVDPIEEQTFGTGLWYHPSMLNHSCAPNCSFTIIGDFYFLVTCREIRSGEELTVSYADMRASYVLRTQYLAHGLDKGFQCQCERCAYLREHPELAELERAVDIEHTAVHTALAEGRTLVEIAKDTGATARRTALKQQLWAVPTQHQAGLITLLALESLLLQQKNARKSLELTLRELELSEIVYGRHFNDFPLLRLYFHAITLAVTYGEFIVAEKLTRRAFDIFCDKPWCQVDKLTFLALYAQLGVRSALPMVEVVVENVACGRSMCNCPGAAFAVAEMAEQLRESFGYGKAQQEEEGKK